MMITGYIEGDELIYSFIKKCKEEYNVQGLDKRRKIDRARQKATAAVKKFKLDASEVEDIFDIIEMETDL